MQNDMNEKIQALAGNKEYIEHLLSLGSAEKMSEELAKEDIDLSANDLRKIYELAKKKEAGELSDKELEEVAGGAVWEILVGVLVPLIMTGIGVGVAFASPCK